MYVCMCVCVYVCMYAWLHGCIYAWMHGCRYVCMYVSNVVVMLMVMHPYIHPYIHTSIHPSLPPSIHTLRRVHAGQASIPTYLGLGFWSLEPTYRQSEKPNGPRVGAWPRVVAKKLARKRTVVARHALKQRKY